MKKTLLLVLLAGIFVCASALAGETAESRGKLKDTLILATWEDLATMDPQSSNRASNWMVQRNIFDTLVRELPDGSVEPELAKSWEFLDDVTVRFHLRDDVKFHNGEPFTAEDVLFTIKRGLSNSISASTFKFFDIDNSKVIDPHTVDLKLHSPYAAIFNTLAGGRGSIVCKKAVEEMGDNRFARNPVGSGPYKLEEWVSGTEIRLVRNDDYWGNKAITKNVVFKIIPEASNRVIELETGGADVIYEVAGTDIDRIDDIDGAHVLMGDSNRYMFITFSMKDKTLADKNLRYALSYALDKDAIVKACYGGAARTATGYYPSNVFAFKEMGVLPYDQEKAKELMKEAGHESGLTLNFLIEPREMDVRLAEAIQNMWNQIGLKVNIFQMAFSNYTSQGNELQIGLRAGNANEPSNILIVYDPEFGERLQPNDEKLAVMLKEAITFYDNAKRSAAYEAVQDYLHDMRYSIPLAFTPVIYGLSDKVEGFECDPLQQVDLCKVSIYE
jgi:peptide/nickel transport system substrate-binding protein